MLKKRQRWREKKIEREREHRTRLVSVSLFPRNSPRVRGEGNDRVNENSGREIR